MSYLTYRDLPLLYTAGFTSGMSGTTQFGVDVDGDEWQAQEGEDNDYLQFRQIFPKSSGSWETMERSRFQSLFNVKAECCGCGGCDG